MHIYHWRHHWRHWHHWDRDFDDDEFYGDRGGPDLARTLGIPVRTWYNYENGVTVPAEIILRIVELTCPLLRSATDQVVLFPLHPAWI